VAVEIKNTELLIDEFDYPLPDDRIAKYPLSKRDQSKLLVYKDGTIEQSVFSEIINYLPQNSLLIYNNTRVIQARMYFRKTTGALIEIFCLEPHAPSDYAQALGETSSCVWKCMVGNQKKWKAGKLEKEIAFGGKSCTLKVSVVGKEENASFVQFEWDNQDVHFAEILNISGELPIPPYLNRKTEESDLKSYQTVYAKIEGSVAAPTAGLHFTPEVLATLPAKNISIAEVTLHVGAGTFQPVKVRNVMEHHMHAEVISVQKEILVKIKENINNVIAVGTTSVRTLESLYYIGAFVIPNLKAGDSIKLTQWAPYDSEVNCSATEAIDNIVCYLDENNLSVLHAVTSIMIRPGYDFKIVKGIITNFHQPKSTLLLLVSAFVKGNWRHIYDYALANDFRFLSYGDSSLLLNK